MRNRDRAVQFRIALFVGGLEFFPSGTLKGAVGHAFFFFVGLQMQKATFSECGDGMP